MLMTYSAKILKTRDAGRTLSDETATHVRSTMARFRATTRGGGEMRCDSCGDTFDGQFDVEGLGTFCRTCYKVVTSVTGHPDFYIFYLPVGV
jgi:hypothetical protein